MSLPQFNPAVMPNNYLIKKFVYTAGRYLWMNDIELIELRKILELRPDIRHEFLTALSVVTQTLIAQCYYKPRNFKGEDVLFTFSEHINLTTLASQCSTSRSTVKRVLDYLEALGDLYKVSIYEPENKRNSPTEIVLTQSLFIRVGVHYKELKDTVQKLIEFENDRCNKQIRVRSKLTNKISKLSKSVLKSLGFSTEKLMNNIDSNRNKQTTSNNKQSANNFGPIANQKQALDSTTEQFINVCKSYTSVDSLNNAMNNTSSVEKSQINAEKQAQSDFLASLTKQVKSVSQNLTILEAGIKAARLFAEFGFNVTDAQILKA